MIHRVPCWECGIETEARDKARCPTCAEVLCPACRPTHESACERHDDALERRSVDAVGQVDREARHQAGEIIAERLIAALGPREVDAWARSALRGVAMDHALCMSEEEAEEVIEAERQWVRAEAQREDELKMFNLQADAHSVEVQFRAPDLIRSLVVMFREVFAANPEAENYLEAKFGDDAGQYVVTIQRPKGKTPNQLRREAEAARDAYRRALIESNRRRREDVHRHRPPMEGDFIWYEPEDGLRFAGRVLSVHGNQAHVELVGHYAAWANNLSTNDRHPPIKVKVEVGRLHLRNTP